MASSTRRDVLLRSSGVAVLPAAAGCTAFGTTEAEIVVENTGRYEERTEYYIDRGDTTTEPTTVELAPRETYTGTIRIARGDVAVVSKGELRIESEFDEFVCRTPVLHVDTGFGAIGGGWRCE